MKMKMKHLHLYQLWKRNKKIIKPLLWCVTLCLYAISFYVSGSIPFVTGLSSSSSDSSNNDKNNIQQCSDYSKYQKPEWYDKYGDFNTIGRRNTTTTTKTDNNNNNNNRIITNTYQLLEKIDISSADEKLYIAIISLPIPEHVKPLKAIARELLKRGDYRVGFGLPLGYKKWIADIPDLEYIPLGDIPEKENFHSHPLENYNNRNRNRNENRSWKQQQNTSSSSSSSSLSSTTIKKDPHRNTIYNFVSSQMSYYLQFQKTMYPELLSFMKDDFDDNDNDFDFDDNFDDDDNDMKEKVEKKQNKKQSKKKKKEEDDDEEEKSKIKNGRQKKKKRRRNNNNRKKSIIDFMIIDRYAFAGYDIAHKLDIPYAINNPHLLFDIDDPPGYIPAPYTGILLNKDLTMWERVINVYYRILFRIENIKNFKLINENRVKFHDLYAITNRYDLYGENLIITNTVFGIEFPRPMNPLFHMVGPLVYELFENKEERMNKKKFKFTLNHNDNNNNNNNNDKNIMKTTRIEINDTQVLDWLQNEPSTIIKNSTTTANKYKTKSKNKQKQKEKLKVKAKGDTVLIDLGPYFIPSKNDIYTIVKGIQSIGMKILWIIPPEIKDKKVIHVLKNTTSSSSNKIYFITPDELVNYSSTTDNNDYDSDNHHHHNKIPEFYYLSGEIGNILRHPRILAMITLGHLYSAQESFMAGKPLITLPLLPEQYEIAKRLEYLKVSFCCNCQTFPSFATNNQIGLSESTASQTKECIFNGVKSFYDDVNNTHTIAINRIKAMLLEGKGLSKTVDLIENTILSQNSLFLKLKKSNFPYSIFEKFDVYIFFAWSIFCFTSCCGFLMKLLFASYENENDNGKQKDTNFLEVSNNLGGSGNNNHNQFCSKHNKHETSSYLSHGG